MNLSCEPNAWRLLRALLLGLCEGCEQEVVVARPPGDYYFRWRRLALSP